MPADPPLRLPLRDGTSALKALALGLYLLAPSLALTVAIATALGRAWSVGITALALLAVFQVVEAPVLAWALLTLLAMVWCGAAALRRAWRYRAVDLIIDSAGIRVEGGRDDGECIARSDRRIDASVSERDGQHVLRIERSPRARSIEIVSGPSEGEAHAFTVIAAAIREHVQQGETGSSQAARVATTEPPVSWLPARRCNQFLGAIALFACAAWMATAVVIDIQYSRGTLSIQNVLLMGGGGAAIIAAPLLILGLRVTRRTWLRLGRLRNTSYARVSTIASVAALPIAFWAVGAGLKPQTEKTIALDECRRGRVEGCVRAGDLEEHDLESGTGPRALAFYERACQATRRTGCFEMARMLREGRRGIPRDLPRALGLFTRACEQQDDRRACITEGLMRWLGEGMPPDRSTAYVRFARGCDAGDGLGCLIQGSIVGEGAVVPRDLERAVHLYRRSCDLGWNDGCLELAAALEAGDGTAADVPAARRLRQAACDRGSAMACSFVADLLLASTDTADRDRGLLLLRKGCNSSQDARSCWRLAWVYLDKRIEERPPYDTSERYLSVGCNLGSRESCADFAKHSSIGPERVKEACANGRTQACLEP